ncbi:hypothetical protein K2173_023460 [Erythroxylum novogranatense]|uniref:AAA+ ATPase domain-containing protein n=1 Tax=Erythroxylum novogranatense TaxID=1862640 RepID=A0AAV8TZ71_9ROSI|nr:hypothetical protein K2173_023460 [Erythroxylum novogranatense]
MGTIPGKIFLVTGPPGVGKTTLITRVFESLKSSKPDLKIQGFFTREIREGTERIGFQVVTLDGRTAPLASSSISHPDTYRWPAVGKYKVDVKSFESVALPEMQIREDTDLFIIDEVGKMELFSTPFIEAVERVLELNVPLLASIPQPKYSSDPPIVAKLRNEPRATIFTLHPSNRDAAKNEMFPGRVCCICETYEHTKE